MKDRKERVKIRPGKSYIKGLPMGDEDLNENIVGGMRS